jgi:flagellar biosynthetic protein FlhB
VNTLKSCLLALIIGAIGMLYLQARLPDLVDVIGMPLQTAMAQAGYTLQGGLLLVVVALALFAAVDVPLQRYQVAEQMKMSITEFKQEQREVEGNAEIKSRQRSRMREVANRRMLAAVPGADLVVMNPTHFAVASKYETGRTSAPSNRRMLAKVPGVDRVVMNPTHYAVALKYEAGRMAAPKVVAKGADLLAFRIRDAAQGAQVPVLQAPALPRALYAHAEVDREVPAALFGVVAQALAHAYQLRAFVPGRGTPAPPEFEVPAGFDPQSTGDTPEPVR